jgi:hypothetical protein
VPRRIGVGDVSYIHHMLLTLIPIAWLGVITLLVALCRMAALGDATRVSMSDDAHADSTAGRVGPWQASIRRGASGRRIAGHGRSTQRSQPLRPRRGAIGHNVR